MPMPALAEAMMRSSSFAADEVDHLLLHVVDRCHGRRQVDLVDHRNDLKSLFDGHVEVRDGLGFHALRSIYNQESPLTGREWRETSSGEVHVAWRIDQVELIGLAVLGHIVHLDGVQLDGDATLLLQGIIVEDLIVRPSPACVTRPVRSSRRSARVDLPWSMWAMMQKFRMFWFESAIGSGLSSTRYRPRHSPRSPSMTLCVTQERYPRPGEPRRAPCRWAGARIPTFSYPEDWPN